jgi:hypothetical protein
MSLKHVITERIADYERKIHIINRMIGDLPKGELYNSERWRLNEKKSCYKTFISELEKDLKTSTEESNYKEYDLNFDLKPNGAIIRLNNESQCVLRICGIPNKLVFEGGNVRNYVDICYPYNSK